MSHGSGVELALPFQVTPLGTIGVENDQRQILSQHLHTIILTGLRERVMRPNYGTLTWEMLFDPINEVGMAMLEQSIRDAIVRFEPDVEVGEVDAFQRDPSSSQVDVRVTYRVRGTDEATITNLVSIDVGGDVSVTTGVQY